MTVINATIQQPRERRVDESFPLISSDVLLVSKNSFYRQEQRCQDLPFWKRRGSRSRLLNRRSAESSARLRHGPPITRLIPGITAT